MTQVGLLMLTHSGRNTNLHFCNRNYFIKRFKDPERLNKLPPIDTLKPARAKFDSAISFFRVELGSDRVKVDQIGALRDKGKLQHAIMLTQNRLLVGYETRIEIWEFKKAVVAHSSIQTTDFEIARVFEHPHLSGIRTLSLLSPQQAVAACSAFDGIHILNLKTGAMDKSWRMPASIYGENYPLSDSVDLRAHYIGNDQQTTHINAADVRDGKVVVSTLIQGAIGEFHLDSGDYKELERGYVGCHGARYDDTGSIYFSDSCDGSLIHINKNGPQTTSKVNSKWLHDSVQLQGDLYAFALADSNDLLIRNVKTGHDVFKKSFITSPFLLLNPFYRWFPGWIGNSNQFLSFSICD